MTGIAGFHDWKRDVQEQKATLLAMTKALSHRQIGSHETVQFADKHLILTAGDVWSAKHVTVAVEGFLYNHQEIAKELFSCGYRFATDGLSELMQTSYLHWGDAFAERLYGAFAFVLCDSCEQKLLFGRDQLGVKPLYLAERDGVVAFGSEIKALLEHPIVTREVDAAGLSEVLLKGPWFTPGQALFRDVQEVKPGHIVRFTPSGKKEIRYWNVESHPHEDSFEETTVKLREMLERNVLHLKGIGLSNTSILSGGLDSSGLIAMICHKLGNEYKTFSGNTPESLEDDLYEERDAPWVKRVMEYLGNPNEEVMVDLDAIMESYHQSRQAQDMPTNANYDLMIYRVFRRIRERGNLSVMVGEGSDELFGTHPWFFEKSLLNAPTFPWNPQGSLLASPDVLRSIRAEEYLQDNYRAYLRDVPKMAGESPEDARRREFLYLALKEYLPTILRRNDRLAMRLNMEVSIPFADPRFAQYVWNIPWETKNYGGRTKGVLREAFRTLLPDNVVDRKKGSNPLRFNKKYADYLHAEYEHLFTDPHQHVYDLVDRKKIQELIDSKLIYENKYIRFRFDYYLQINHWLREYNVVFV
jgi:asparagine synthase (glutamine-hydrolysing)